MDAQPEKTQRRDEEKRKTKAQAELGRQRRNRGGQNLARNPPPPPSATRRSRLNKFQTDDIHGHRPRQPKHLGRIEDGDRDDEPWQRRAEHRKDDESEDERRQ